MADPTLIGLGQAAPLVELGESAKSTLILISVCSLRGYVAMAVLPATNDQLIQGIVRNGLALTFGAFVAFGQPFHVLDNMSAMQLLVMVMKEGLIGLLIGLGVSSVFWTIEGVGMLIDNQAGYNSVQQNNPLTGEQSTPVANMLMQLAVSGFYLLGGMMVFAQLLFDSFRWWPLSSTMPDWGQLIDRFLPSEIRTYTETVLIVASPVIVMLMLIDVAIGLLSKAADKLEPNSHAQPIKGAVAMLMLITLIALFFQEARPQLSMRPAAKKIELLLSDPSAER